MRPQMLADSPCVSIHSVSLILQRPNHRVNILRGQVLASFHQHLPQVLLAFESGGVGDVAARRRTVDEKYSVGVEEGEKGTVWCLP